MPLEKLEILGYRGFREHGTVNFSIPDGNFGSGITILTGTNNSGKSSILECLRARSGGTSPSFTVGARNFAVDEVKIKYFINGQEEIIKSVRKGSSETSKINIDQTFQIFVLPSRRAFNPYFSRNEHSREQYLYSNPLPAQRSSMLSGFEYRLFKVLQDPEVFNSILQEVLLFKPDWSIDQSDQGQYFLKFFNGNHAHSSDGMGEGIVSIFSIVDSLYDSKPSDVVVIDEPELSLHPSLQKRLSKLLNKFAQDRQIIISTHSPYFADLKAISNGGTLARIVSNGKGTTVHQISQTSRTSIKKLSENNIFNPHVFGLDARELFFQEDNIILTEGQEDVLLYPEVAEQVEQKLEGSFFGWGAGGAGNIKHLCGVLSDLGFSKVASLLDSDKADEAKELKLSFPQYFLIASQQKILGQNLHVRHQVKSLAFSMRIDNSGLSMLTKRDNA
jgi:predicted ATP-dependent endonuclease of OLD family